MTRTPIQTDADGIPILDELVDLDEERTTVETAAPQPEPPDLDHDVLERLATHPAIADLLDDITVDLQSLVTWKIQEFLKHEIQQVIQEAVQRSGPQLSESIRAQLQQALPALLSEAFEHIRDPGEE
jgi:hypothetical protein